MTFELCEQFKNIKANPVWRGQQTGGGRFSRFAYKHQLQVTPLFDWKGKPLLLLNYYFSNELANLQLSLKLKNNKKYINYQLRVSYLQIRTLN